MEKRNENGAEISYDFEIFKVINKRDCGLTVINVIKHEAEKFEYGFDDYINMLKREIEIYESEMIYYDENSESEYQYFIRDGLEEIRKAIIEIEQAKNVHCHTDNSKAQTENQTSNDLICDEMHLLKLYANYNNVGIWEKMKHDDFLNCMRVEPIGNIKPKNGNKDFAKWIFENIEKERKIKNNINDWFKKLVGKNISYSTLKKSP